MKADSGEAGRMRAGKREAADGLRVPDVLGAGWRLVFDAGVRLWFICHDHPDTDVVYEEVKK